MAAMKVTKQVYEIVPVDSLTIHPANPRRGDVGAIGESIEANGFYGAVIVQKSTGYVLAGNHRLLAAEEAGADSLPVIRVDVDDATATRILLADNRTNDVATYDQEALAALLVSLSEAGALTGSGYAANDVDALLRVLEPPDLDALADEYGAPSLSDTFPTIRIVVTPEIMAAWRAHVDTHSGDEVQALASLLGVPV